MFFVVLAAVLAAIFLVALLLDHKDRQRGRRTRIRVSGWLQREGQVAASHSPAAYLLDVTGEGDIYSSDRLRRGDGEDRPQAD